MENILDIRHLPPPEKHPAIFALFDKLAAGETFILINDHEPKPLYYQFMAEQAGQFTWEYLETGPTIWQVRIGKQVTEGE